MPSDPHSDPGEAIRDLNPTGRFSDRVADYVRYRPDYPAAVLDAVLDGLGAPRALIAVDVGAGTGIWTRQLADRGVTVHAVEPNRDMRAAAAPHPRVTWHAGTGEATGLETACARLVTCAQAFHWLRHGEAVAEFHRVLEPDGRLVVLWNKRDRGDDLTRGYTECIDAVQGDDPIEAMQTEPDAIAARGEFTPPRQVEFPHAHVLDLDGFIGRAMSASYVPKDGPRSAALREHLTALHARFADADGRVTMRYVTRAHIARRI